VADAVEYAPPEHDLVADRRKDGAVSPSASHGRNNGQRHGIPHAYHFGPGRLRWRAGEVSLNRKNDAGHDHQANAAQIRVAIRTLRAKRPAESVISPSPPCRTRRSRKMKTHPPLEDH